MPDEIETAVGLAERDPAVKVIVLREPAGLSNRSPGLGVRWDAAKLGITGQQVAQILDTTEPRILVGGSRGAQNGVSITAFNLAPVPRDGDLSSADLLFLYVPIAKRGENSRMACFTKGRMP